MAFVTVSVIAATSSSSASGKASLGANGANKFAVIVECPAALSLVGSIAFAASWDGSTYYPVDPSAVRGNVFIFDAPAANVGVSFAGNPTGNSVTVLAYAYTD